MKEDIPLWSVPLQQVYNTLESSEQGLSSSEAKKRLVKYGTNEIAKKEGKVGLTIFLSQFNSPLVYILIIASIISFFLQDRINALVILSIVLLNSVLGFFQEYKAERAVRELRKYISLKFNVIRNGEIVILDSKHIVPGDIVYLRRGDIVPADIRHIELKELSADESSLTGESVPVQKSTAQVGAEYTLPQDLKNMVFMGTVVTSGSGKGIVVATGKDTFLGKTAAYLKDEWEVGDFQRGIHAFSNLLFKVIIIMTIFIFAANAFLNKDVATSFLFAIALAVGITPEVLPIIMTISLSNGAVKMAREKVITKRLSSVEDLGNIDVLCCDKTGTLTEGTLSLQDFVDVGGKKDRKLLLYGALCNSIKKQKGVISFDNPIDHAIWQSKEIANIEPQIKEYSILSENEFDFDRRRMSVLIKKGKDKILIVKGAAESILNVCDFAQIDGKKVRLSRLTGKIHDLIEHYEQDGYNSIAIAEKNIDKDICTKEDEQALTLIGFLFFIDPPKKTVKESLKMLKKLDVQVKVISGDSLTITRRICNEIGLVIVEDKIVRGEELESLNESQFREYCQKYTVFSRVSPEQKYKIVHVLKEQGHIVGFLGDGINDAPALHAANVGISVDTASGIAKETADIILLKKSLRVLAHGIIEGRKTFSNITKYVLNTISANYGNMFTVAASSLFLKFIPLLPSQILLNNFLSDFPMLTISTDNVDEQSLKKPKHWDIKLISQFMVYFGIISCFFDLLLIVPLVFIINVGPELFRTSWFVLSILSEILITFAIRTKLPFFKSRPSRWLVVTSILTLVVSIVIINTKFGNVLFSFVGIPFTIWLFIGFVLIAYFSTTEVIKQYFFRKHDM